MVFDFGAIVSDFTACELCYSKLLSKVFMEKPFIENSCLCKKWTTWSMECCNGKLDFPPPEHYPRIFFFGKVKMQMLIFVFIDCIEMLLDLL